MLQHRLHPAPGFLLLVAAHEQVQAAVEHVEQQPLVGAHAPAAEALVEVEIEVRGRQRRCGAARDRAPALALGEQVQFQPVARLQVDDEPVGCTRWHLKDGMGHGAEIHHDVGLARAQALAGAQVEGHAGPAPVVDLGPQRDESLGRAVRGNAGFVAVAGHRGTADRARGVLAAHQVLRERGRGPGFERAQDLELLVADGVGVGIDGRFHGQRAQQLQGVVLDHVAQRAGAVVEAAALFHAELLGNGDLDVGDGFAPPQRFEQGVAEAQREQVLHGRLAQVVVDAEHLPFVEHRPHRGIDGAVGGEVVAQGLLQHDARGGCGQACRGQMAADGGEQRRAGGQVHHRGVGGLLAQPRGQAGVVLRPRQIHAHIVQARCEAREFVGPGALVAFDVGKTGADPLAVTGVVELVARDADDPALRRQAAVAESLEQGRQQLAPGEVAGAAEKNQVEAHGVPQGVPQCNLISGVEPVPRRQACLSEPCNREALQSLRRALGIDRVIGLPIRDPAVTASQARTA